MDRYRTQMVMAMNPCHCGYFNHPEIECTCTAINLHRYQGVLSGALLDRIDLQLMQGYAAPKGKSETSEKIRRRVLEGYKIQLDRSGKQNARLTLDELKPLVLHNSSMKRTFLNYLKNQQWSLRKQRSILSVVLTISDLAGQTPGIKHMEEAVMLSRFTQKEEGVKKSSTQYKRPTIVLGPGMKVRSN
jgi:magnesium chelatase family protein